MAADIPLYPAVIFVLVVAAIFTVIGSPTSTQLHFDFDFELLRSLEFFRGVFRCELIALDLEDWSWEQ